MKSRIPKILKWFKSSGCKILTITNCTSAEFWKMKSAPPDKTVDITPMVMDSDTESVAESFHSVDSPQVSPMKLLQARINNGPFP